MNPSSSAIACVSSDEIITLFHLSLVTEDVLFFGAVGSSRIFASESPVVVSFKTFCCGPSLPSENDIEFDKSFMIADNFLFSVTTLTSTRISSAPCFVEWPLSEA